MCVRASVLPLRGSHLSYGFTTSEHPGEGQSTNQSSQMFDLRDVGISVWETSIKCLLEYLTFHPYIWSLHIFRL